MPRLFLGFIFSVLLAPPLFACQTPSLASEFRHSSVLSCPLFASFVFGRMSQPQSMHYKALESDLRNILLQQKISGDVRIKIGVEIVSPEEVWFTPELALFYSDKNSLARFNQLLQKLELLKLVKLIEDELLITVAFQGYLSHLDATYQSKSETFMSTSSDEWPEFSGAGRLQLWQQQTELVKKLKTQASLDNWKNHLTSILPQDHYLNWDLVEARRGQKIRLSTYFDYQWYSGRAPDNNNLSSDLIDDFEVDLIHAP
jgi:hypothetical protein